ncbi:winged helix-turn-helix transcriptional regulator [Nocardia sp. NPDC051750]|uniref:winged helix-turn-helix transcriptional regulator n=1 Tax=Nocardia sp. NPDC051750 TaxID=3364325 RepID=UPI0037A89E84
MSASSSARRAPSGRTETAYVVTPRSAGGSAPGRTPTKTPPSRTSARYSELSRRLAGVSQKMLTQTLRSLERDGLVTRTVTPTVPVTVTYELTDLGLSLHQVVRGIKIWAEAHMDEVLANCEVFDSESSSPAGVSV